VTRNGTLFTCQANSNPPPNVYWFIYGAYHGNLSHETFSTSDIKLVKSLSNSPLLDVCDIHKSFLWTQSNESTSNGTEIDEITLSCVAEIGDQRISVDKGFFESKTVEEMRELCRRPDLTDIGSCNLYVTCCSNYGVYRH
jgi:hypothetical protein